MVDSSALVRPPGDLDDLEAAPGSAGRHDGAGDIDQADSAGGFDGESAGARGSYGWLMVGDAVMLSVMLSWMVKGVDETFRWILVDRGH